ncbi:MAG: hypothetical protein WD492_09310 [Alkalispirochaeta sp.]
MPFGGSDTITAGIYQAPVPERPSVADRFESAEVALYRIPIRFYFDRFISAS